MNELEKFLNLPSIESLTEEIFVNERIGKVTIKAMTSDDFSNYQRRATKPGAKKSSDIDPAKFNLYVSAGQVIAPDFNNAEFLEKAGFPTVESFMKNKFLVGELATIANAVSKLSGFSSSFEEDVEEAKN